MACIQLGSPTGPKYIHRNRVSNSVSSVAFLLEVRK